MFRVCVVNANLPPEYGGAEIAAYRYAERLDRAGCSPVVVGAVRDDGRPREPLPPYVHPLKLMAGKEPRRGPRSRGRAVMQLAEIGLRLWPRIIALRHQYDVVHVFNSAPLFNLMAVPVARSLRKPVVLEMSLLGSDDPLTLRRSRNGRQKRLISRPPLRYLLYRAADGYVSKSAALSDAYRRAGLSESRLFEIPYAVDVGVYQPATDIERRACRASVGIAPNRTTILFVGGINRRKGVHLILEAFRDVLKHHPESQLVIVGPTYKYESSYYASLQAAVREWGLSGHVVFTCKVASNVAEYMRAADVFVLPSTREGLPISVLEAMACGLAIVASDIPEIARSQIQHCQEGLLVPVGDVGALAGALARVICDKGLRARIGAAARERAVREFSVESVDGRYQDLYSQLVQERRTWPRARAAGV